MTAPAAQAVAPNDPEIACRLVNLAWYLVASRLPYRSHAARLKALEAEGRVPDEVTFPRMAVGAR